MRRRIFSLALALMLALSLCVPALAASAPSDWNKFEAFWNKADGTVTFEATVSRSGGAYRANIAKYAEQLCLSPVGRARMGVLAAKKEEEADPTADFFAKYGN